MFYLSNNCFISQTFYLVLYRYWITLIRINLRCLTPHIGALKTLTFFSRYTLIRPQYHFSFYFVLIV